MRYLVSTLCLVLTASSAPAEDALPHHTILRAAGPIAVDGHLDEPSWEAAQVIDQFTWSNTLTPKPQFHVPERFGVVHFDSRPVLSLQDEAE